MKLQVSSGNLNMNVKKSVNYGIESKVRLSLSLEIPSGIAVLM